MELLPTAVEGFQVFGIGATIFLVLAAWLRTMYKDKARVEKELKDHLASQNEVDRQLVVSLQSLANALANLQAATALDKSNLMTAISDNQKALHELNTHLQVLQAYLQGKDNKGQRNG